MTITEFNEKVIEKEGGLTIVKFYAPQTNLKEIEGLVAKLRWSVKTETITSGF